MSWAERSSFPDMKHPNHLFLLQNIFDKLTFDNPEEHRLMKLARNEKDDLDPWKKFFLN